jgi:hypothetical protein
MLHDIDNGAMNAPQHWQLRDDVREYNTFFLSLRLDKFHGRVGN